MNLDPNDIAQLALEVTPNHWPLQANKTQQLRLVCPNKFILVPRQGPMQDREVSCVKSVDVTRGLCSQYFMQITTMQMTTKHAWQLMHTSKPGEAMTCNIGISTLVTSHGHAMVRLQTLKKGEAVSIRPCAFTLANF